MATIHDVEISFVDKANKPSGTGVSASLAQIGAYNTTPTAGDIFDWFAAMAELSLLPVTRQVAVTGERNVSSLPSDDAAYRSAKLTVFYHDATTDQKGHFQIPGRDPAKFNSITGTKVVPLTIAEGGTAEVEALVAASQKLYTPDGHLMVIDQIVVSGGKQ